MDESERLPMVGRGAQVSPPNRYQRIHIENISDHLEHDEEYVNRRRIAQTNFTKTIPNRLFQKMTVQIYPSTTA